MSQTLGPFPSSVTAPSIWYEAAAAPQTKSVGKLWGLEWGRSLIDGPRGGRARQAGRGNPVVASTSPGGPNCFVLSCGPAFAPPSRGGGGTLARIESRRETPVVDGFSLRGRRRPLGRKR